MCVVVFIVCVSAQEMSRLIKAKAFEGVIMSESCNFDAELKQFELTNDEIFTIEEQLSMEIKLINKDHVNQFKKSVYIELLLSQNKRQYVA